MNNSFGIMIFAVTLILIFAIFSDDEKQQTQVVFSGNVMIINHIEGDKTFIFYADRRDSSVYRMDFYTTDSLKPGRHIIGKDVDRVMFHKEILSEINPTIPVIAKIFPAKSEEAMWMQRKFKSVLLKVKN
jgi:hypothetical protein